VTVIVLVVDGVSAWVCECVRVCACGCMAWWAIVNEYTHLNVYSLHDSTLSSHSLEFVLDGVSKLVCGCVVAWLRGCVFALVRGLL